MSAPSMDKRYTLRQPCNNCPFRPDVKPYLRPDRAQEIARSLREGGEFACHKTTVPVDTDDDGTDLADIPGVSRFCAGALATMEREGASNQMTRIAERLGLYNPDTLNADALPVYASLTDWVRSYQDIPTVTDEDGNVLEYEHCGVVDDDCEDPAGYGGGYGGAYGNDDEPTCDPLMDCCEGCGHTACVACRSEQWDEVGGQFCTICYVPDND